MNLTANPSPRPHPTPTLSVLARLRTVAQATRAALANPEDTSQVFRIAEALTFGSPERMLRRFRGDADGAPAARPSATTCSRSCATATAWPRCPRAASAAPTSRSSSREGITADGLVEASMDGTDARYYEDDDLGWMRVRMRDSHDLWHTVTGYKGDLLGEASLLAFTFAQTRHPGIGFLAALGAILNPTPRADA